MFPSRGCVGLFFDIQSGSPERLADIIGGSLIGG